MGGRTWRSSRDFYCNGLLRKRDPNAARGSNGWAPAQASRSVPAAAPALAPAPKAGPEETRDFVYDSPAGPRMSSSSHALPGERGEAYSYYHPKSSAHQEHEDAAGVPLPASQNSSLRDLLKAEENHGVKTRRRFEIAKDYYGPQGDGQPVPRNKHVSPPGQRLPRKRAQEPQKPISLFKQTMMAISKYTYM